LSCISSLRMPADSMSASDKKDAAGTIRENQAIGIQCGRHAMSKENRKNSACVLARRIHPG